MSGKQGWEVTFKKELSYNYSYFQVRNLGTLITSVTVTTIKGELKRTRGNLVPVSPLLPNPGHRSRISKSLEGHFSHFLLSSLVQQAAAQFTRRETLPCNHDLTLTRCSAQPLFSRYHLPRREYVSVHKIHESHSPSVGRCYSEYFAKIWITDMN